MALKGWVTKRPWGRSGGWRRKASKARRVKQGDLRGARGKAELPDHRAGVRALVVAMKPGNAGGAKGCRKVET
jgi:hypothetical protein